KSITDTIRKGQNIIQLSSVEGLEVGDGINIKTNEVYSTRIGYGYDYLKGFTTKITKIQGLHVTIKDPVPYDFNFGTDLLANIYNPVNVFLKDVKVKVIGASSRTTAFYLSNVFGGRIVNATGENCTVAHTYIQGCYNLKFDDIEIQANLIDSIGLNYGIYIQNSTNIYIDRLKAN